jgi:hypothetical protein
MIAFSLMKAITPSCRTLGADQRIVSVDLLYRPSPGAADNSSRRGVTLYQWFFRWLCLKALFPHPSLNDGVPDEVLFPVRDMGCNGAGRSRWGSADLKIPIRSFHHQPLADDETFATGILDLVHREGCPAKATGIFSLPGLRRRHPGGTVYTADKILPDGVGNNRSEVSPGPGVSLRLGPLELFIMPVTRRKETDLRGFLGR